VTDDAYVRDIEEQRERSRVALRGPTSVLAAIARYPLPMDRETRIGPDGAADIRLEGLDRVVVVKAERDGFVVDGAPMKPRIVDAGRYGLRLSHQNHPSLVVLDRESARLRDDVTLRWYPVDRRFRLHGRLETDGSRQAIGSTASPERPAERVGWVHLVIDGVACRLAVLRMLEPGFAAGHMDVYFRDATTGNGSYEVGRYVTARADRDGVIVDFNLAYNPSCALSPYYNCPIPPRENHLTVPILAGEMTPLVAAHD
jgi:uncharacterized protein